MPTYRVYQSFETLGDPAGETFTNRDAAETYAADLANAIADQVADLDTNGTNNPDCNLGFASEVEAWEQAEILADGDTYGPIAGRYIASCAVRLDEQQPTD